MCPCHCEPVRRLVWQSVFPVFWDTDSHASVLCSALRAASVGCALHAPAGAVAQNDRVVCILQQSLSVTLTAVFSLAICQIFLNHFLAGYRIYGRAMTNYNGFANHSDYGKELTNVTCNYSLRPHQAQPYDIPMRALQPLGAEHLILSGRCISHHYPHRRFCVQG